jgi:hypothetical protein
MTLGTKWSERCIVGPCFIPCSVASVACLRRVRAPGAAEAWRARAPRVASRRSLAILASVSRRPRRAERTRAAPRWSRRVRTIQPSSAVAISRRHTIGARRTRIARPRRPVQTSTSRAACRDARSGRTSIFAGRASSARAATGSAHRASPWASIGKFEVRRVASSVQDTFVGVEPQLLRARRRPRRS